MRIIYGAIGFLFALILAFFAIHNRETVSLVLTPIHDPLTLPIYLISLTSMAGGFIVGSILVWLNAFPVRRELKKQRKQLKAIEKKLESFEETSDKEGGAEFFPALPKQKR